MKFSTITLDESVSPVHDVRAFTWCAMDSRNIVLLYAAKLNGVLKWVMQHVSFPVASSPIFGPVSAIANVSTQEYRFSYPRLSYAGDNKFAAVLPQTLQQPNNILVATARVSIINRIGDYFVHDRQFDYDIKYNMLPIPTAVSVPGKALVGYQEREPSQRQITHLFDINTGSRRSTYSVGPQSGTNQTYSAGITCFHRRDIDGNPWIATVLPNTTSAAYSSYSAAFLSKFDKNTGENDGTLAALTEAYDGSWAPFNYALRRGFLGFLPTRGKKFIQLQHSNNGFSVCEITGTPYNQVAILSTTDNFMGIGKPQECTYHDAIWLGDNYFMALVTHGKMPQPATTGTIDDNTLYDLDMYVGKFDEDTNSITQANYFPAKLNLKIHGVRAADSCLHKIDDTNVAIIARLASADATDAGEARISIAIMST